MAYRIVNSDLLPAECTCTEAVWFWLVAMNFLSANFAYFRKEYITKYILFISCLVFLTTKLLIPVSCLSKKKKKMVNAFTVCLGV